MTGVGRRGGKKCKHFEEIRVNNLKIEKEEKGNMMRGAPILSKNRNMPENV